MLKKLNSASPKEEQVASLSRSDETSIPKGHKKHVFFKGILDKKLNILVHSFALQWHLFWLSLCKIARLSVTFIFTNNFRTDLDNQSLNSLKKNP